jgi:glycosyltransferase involved in cell wall biosynthesis
MIKIAEYMGCGRPVIAYDLRETRRTAGAAALYAPAGEREAFVDLICDLARDGERRLGLGALARRRALELTWERSEQALRGVYERLDRPSRAAKNTTVRALVCQMDETEGSS